MSSSYDEFEGGDPSLDEEESPPQSMNDVETRLSAELAAYLEDELSLDTRRLRIFVRDRTVYVQGTLESREDLKACIELLEGRSEVREVVSSLTVQISQDF